MPSVALAYIDHVEEYCDTGVGPNENFKKYQRILWNTSFLGKSLLDVKQGVTEAWSYDHFQPEMGLLGSAGRQDEKKLKLKYAYF